MSIVVDVTANPLGGGLTGKAILDAAISHIQDKSTGMRASMATWLTPLFQQVRTERDWLFLHTVASVAVDSSVIVKPADFGELVYVSGDGWFLDQKHRLTDREAFEMTDDNAVDPTPAGFEETTTLLTLRPGASGTATLKYSRLVPAGIDSTTPTVWPWKFLPLFERAILTAYYEYDSDQRGMPSFSLDQMALDRLKYDDNRLRPIPKAGRKGYLRWR